MAGALLPVWRYQATANGAPVPGAKLYTYLSGTNTPQATYTTQALNIALSNPVEADDTGLFPAIYLAPVTYRVTLTDADGVTVIPAQDGVSDIGQILQATLAQWPAPSDSAGRVVVYPPQTYGGTWIPVAPDGTAITTTGTTTSGLQEAVDYAIANACGLVVAGGGDISQVQSGGAAVAFIASGSTLALPNTQGRTFEFRDVTINGNGTGTEPVVQLNSSMMGYYLWTGSQIVGNNRSGHCVVIAPVDPVPVDNEITVIDSVLNLPSIVGTTTTAGKAALYLDETSGDILASTIYSPEINQGDFQILVKTPPTARAVGLGLRIVCPHVHGSFGANPHVLVGNASGADNARLRDIAWDLTIVRDGGSKRAFDTHETRGSGTIKCVGFSTDFNILFEAEATQCRFLLVTDSSAIGVVRDESTARDNHVTVSRPPTNAAITPSGSPFMYPAATDYDRVARTELINVQGGTTTKVEIGNGSTWHDTGETAGLFTKYPGLYLRVTYAVAPTMESWVI